MTGIEKEIDRLSTTSPCTKEELEALSSRIDDIADKGGVMVAEEWKVFILRAYAHNKNIGITFALDDIIGLISKHGQNKRSLSRVSLMQDGSIGTEWTEVVK